MLSVLLVVSQHRVVVCVPSVVSSVYRRWYRLCTVGGNVCVPSVACRTVACSVPLMVCRGVVLPSVYRRWCVAVSSMYYVGVARVTKAFDLLTRPFCLDVIAVIRGIRYLRTLGPLTAPSRFDKRVKRSYRGPDRYSYVTTTHVLHYTAPPRPQGLYLITHERDEDAARRRWKGAKT
ncbi:hypothetical protein E2C01_052507 [Portunus trituberculatus]|uniref:Secreted protein n=1 Tax=Portunus trituberculatus TaxID=210409 RepID=A0A5B7GDX6_PORTR|nr:hypothetical protein [Portunus trituberculatus]